MVATTEIELAAAGITSSPEVVLADAGYWHQAQMETLTGRGTVVLIAPDAGKRKGARPGWDGGPYAFMRRVLASQRGGELYSKRQGMIEPVFAHTKFNRRIDRFQRRGRSAVRSEMAAHHRDAQLAQAPQAHHRAAGGLNRPPRINQRPARLQPDARTPSASAETFRSPPYATATAHSASEGARAQSRRRPYARPRCAYAARSLGRAAWRSCRSGAGVSVIEAETLAHREQRRLGLGCAWCRVPRFNKLGTPAGTVDDYRVHLDSHRELWGLAAAAGLGLARRGKDRGGDRAT